MLVSLMPASTMSVKVELAVILEEVNEPAESATSDEMVAPNKAAVEPKALLAE
jgi:hypothetical protein